MLQCKHTCFCVCEWAVNFLSEAVKRGSEMRARQFEVGNERCPFSFERHIGLSLSQTPPPLICQLPSVVFVSRNIEEESEKEESGKKTKTGIWK